MRAHNNGRQLQRVGTCGCGCRLGVAAHEQRDAAGPQQQRNPPAACAAPATSALRTCSRLKTLTAVLMTSSGTPFMWRAGSESAGSAPGWLCLLEKLQARLPAALQLVLLLLGVHSASRPHGLTRQT